MTEHKLRSAVGVLMLALLLAPDVLLAQPSVDDAMRVSRQGLTFNARALGMGNAYSTIGYDFSALRLNPATMGLSEGASYTMSVNTNGFLYSSSFFGSQDKFTTTNTTLSQAGFTIPFKLDSTRQAVIGLGYTQDKDFNMGGRYDGFNTSSSSFVTRLAQAPNQVARDLGLIFPVYDKANNYLGDQTVLTGNFQEHGDVLDGGEMLHFSGGISLEAISGVFFGVSGSYNMGSYQSDAEFSATNSQNLFPGSVETIPGDSTTYGFQDATYRMIRSTEYKGWDVRFGVIYRLWNFIGISASFKIPSHHTVNETDYFSGTTNYTNHVRTVEPNSVSQSYTYSIRPPYEATVGAMVNLWILTGTAEATYVDYTQMQVTGGPAVAERSTINKMIK